LDARDRLCGKKQEVYLNKNYTFEEGGIVRITNPQTGKLWYNYLWNNDGYLIGVSHTGGGSSMLVHEKGNVALHGWAGINDCGAEHRYLYPAQ
jgi:hypothetical protein